MKILVAVKRVVDYNVKVRAKADGSGVETANLKKRYGCRRLARPRKLSRYR